jgi:hypothetical protein
VISVIPKLGPCHSTSASCTHPLPRGSSRSLQKLYSTDERRHPIKIGNWAREITSTSMSILQRVWSWSIAHVEQDIQASQCSPHISTQGKPEGININCCQRSRAVEMELSYLQHPIMLVVRQERVTRFKKVKIYKDTRKSPFGRTNCVEVWGSIVIPNCLDSNFASKPIHRISGRDLF